MAGYITKTKSCKRRGGGREARKEEVGKHTRRDVVKEEGKAGRRYGGV